MKNNSITIVNASKTFKIYSNPLDRIKDIIFYNQRSFHKKFFALKDINVNIEVGESLALIGRNGSGKSTLLQLISKILQPTEGSVAINGKIAALLELGSGFNPEFTGRENVLLNAAIYGLSRRDVMERMNKILAFADIGDFIDQPTKTYSSGMQLRLAFAVIAHVDADILVVDEALAVGDAVFTQKCMRFIREFSKRGTLLFVSHDPAMVQNLCKRAIWLENGTIKEDGNSRDVCRNYLQSTLQNIYGEKIKLRKVQGNQYSSLQQREDKDHIKNNISRSSGWTTDHATIVDAALLDPAGAQLSSLEGGEDVKLEITAVANAELRNPILGFMVRDRLGQDLFGENTLNTIEKLAENTAKKGEFITASFQFKMPMLPNGEYAVTISVADGSLNDHIQHEYLHEALILNFHSDKVRWGLVGIKFQSVNIQISDKSYP